MGRHGRSWCSCDRLVPALGIDRAYSVNGTDNGDGLWTLVAGCIAGGLVIRRLLVGALVAFVIATLLGGYELLNVSAVESDASFWR